MRYLKALPVIFLAVFFLFSFQGVLAKAPSTQPSMLSKGCLNCHKGFQKQKDILAGNFKSRSKKAGSIQVKIGNRMELVKYTPLTEIKNVPNIKSLKEPIPIRVHFKRVGHDLVATKIVAKPKMEVPKKQLMSAQELAQLVALGPDKGQYSLVDSRPGIKYNAGHIPTAVSIPFPKMKQLKDKLPQDKDRLLIFYCEGKR